MIHELKTWPVHFHKVKSGLKTFEVRKNDRDFKEGDELILKEYIPETEDDQCWYTGNICHRKITYILHGGQFGIEEGYVILGLEKI